MPKLADDEAAEHRRDRERHAGDRADHAVGAVASVLGDEQRDARRHGDAAHHPGDGSGQRGADEDPEPRAVELEQVVGVDSHEHDGGQPEARRPDSDVASTIAVCLRWWST